MALPTGLTPSRVRIDHVFPGLFVQASLIGFTVWEAGVEPGFHVFFQGGPRMFWVGSPVAVNEEFDLPSLRRVHEPVRTSLLPSVHLGGFRSGGAV